MTLKTIRQQLRKIRAAAKKGDFEVAHILEDFLFHLVLSVIARGEYEGYEARYFAAEALKSLKIKFTRAMA